MKVLTALTSAALLATMSQALASPVTIVPNPLYSGSVETNTNLGTPFQPQLSAPGSASWTATSFSATSTGQATITSTQSVSSQLNLNVVPTSSLPPGYPQSSAGGAIDAYTRYEFAISGPGSSVLVDVSATGGVSSTALPAGGNIFARALFSVSGSSTLLNYDAIAADPSYGVTPTVPGTAATGFSGGFSVSTSLSLLTGTLYYVYIYSQADGGVNGNPGYSGGTLKVSAFVDPMFTIDPSTLNANQYSLTFSPGISNAATPLPSTWLMLLGGLAGLGFVAHRGAKNGAAALAAT